MAWEAPARYLVGYGLDSGGAMRGLPLFRCGPHTRKRTKVCVGPREVLDCIADHFERPVELEQQRIEEHDVADRNRTRPVTRHQERERERELRRQRDAVEAGIENPLRAEPPPVVEHFPCANDETLVHPCGAAKVA